MSSTVNSMVVGGRRSIFRFRFLFPACGVHFPVLEIVIRYICVSCVESIEVFVHKAQSGRKQRTSESNQPWQTHVAWAWYVVPVNTCVCVRACACVCACMCACVLCLDVMRFVFFFFFVGFLFFVFCFLFCFAAGDEGSQQRSAKCGEH